MAYQSPRTPIGERRHRITVRLAQTSDDGMGGTVSSTDVFRRQQMWAKVTPLDERTKEALAAQQITARHGYFFDVPYTTGIDPTWEVEWDGQTLQIHSAVDDEGKKRRLLLQCGEVQG